MKNDRRNYVMVGAFVALVLAIFVAWVAMISGRAGATDAYHVFYQRVPGLKAGAQVLFQGHQIGFIDGIEFEPSERDFRVHVELERGWPIPDDSVALIKASGLLSAVVIDIQAGASTRNLPPGSAVPSEEPADLFGALASAAERLGGLMSDDVQPLLQALRGDVPEILGAVQGFMNDANETVRRINSVLREENAERLDRIVVNAEQTSQRVAGLMGDMQDTRSELHEAIVAVNGVVQARQGDLNRTLVDLQRSLEAVAIHIDAIAASLESATRDAAAFSNQIRRDPSLVLRGRARVDDPQEAE